jgi:hypothetical protein
METKLDMSISWPVLSPHPPPSSSILLNYAADASLLITSSIPAALEKQGWAERAPRRRRNKRRGQGAPIRRMPARSGDGLVMGEGPNPWIFSSDLISVSSAHNQFLFFPTPNVRWLPGTSGLLRFCWCFQSGFICCCFRSDCFHLLVLDIFYGLLRTKIPYMVHVFFLWIRFVPSVFLLLI